MVPSEGTRRVGAAVSDPPATGVGAAASCPAPERDVQAIDEGNTHVQERTGEVGEDASGDVGRRTALGTHAHAGSEGIGHVGGERAAVHETRLAETDSSRPQTDRGVARAKVEAGPTVLTLGERKAWRMGVMHGLDLAARGHAWNSVVRTAIDELRLRVAARSIDCEAPSCWPQRGGA